jgi:predicted TIM-barrel fold metal-dependent hydrolase
MMDAYTHLDMSAMDPIEDLQLRMISAEMDRALIVETWSQDNFACLERLIAQPSPQFRVALCFRPEEERQGLDVHRHEMIAALRVRTADIRRLGRVADLLESSGKWLLPHAEAGIKALKNELLPLAKAHPELGIYLPHLGWPLHDKKHDEDWKDAMKELSHLRNIVVGISAISYFSREAYPHNDIEPFVNALLNSFGADSIVVGSDYPLLQKDMYPDYIRLARRWIQHQAAASPSHFESYLFGFAKPTTDASQGP